MFLSQLLLNVRNLAVRRDLARPYEMHRTLLNGGFNGRTKDEFGRVLFRVDPSHRDGPPVVLVQSDGLADWANLPAGYAIGQPKCKTLEVAVTEGQRLRFRLRANCTKRIAAKNPEIGAAMAGKRIGLVSEHDRIRWLLRKGEAGGFRVPGEWIQAREPETDQPVQLPNFRMDVVPEGLHANSKPGFGGKFMAVRFEGILIVTDPQQFRTTLFAGIGSGKGFGFGLLSVAPA